VLSVVVATDAFASESAVAAATMAPSVGTVPLADDGKGHEGNASKTDGTKHSDTKAQRKPAPDTDTGGPRGPAATAPSTETEPTKPAEAKKKHTAAGTMSEADEKWLSALLAGVDAKEAHLELVERTAERQARVMNALAKEDLEKARATYCPAGDSVLEVFDPKQSDSVNVQRMTAELISQLPTARQLGCLNHIYNEDVYSVDVPLDDVPEAQRSKLAEAAQEAEQAGRIERFLQPPKHPGSYHFEFKR